MKWKAGVDNDYLKASVTHFGYRFFIESKFDWYGQWNGRNTIWLNLLTIE